MNFWLLTLTLVNILLMTFMIFNWFVRNKSTNQEDQRLTKGLQLLQNKISILQDLSDKSDEQVRRWVHLLEQKSFEVQGKLNESDEKVIQIESVLSKALDVSKIFYDQVPHAEIVERQKTSKYVQAAKLANQGFTADQISQKIDLNVGEIDMIIKMNREKLQFAEENLPAWVEHINPMTASAQDSAHQQEIQEFGMQLKKMNQMVSSTAFDVAKPDMSSMENIKQQFTESIAMNSTQIPQTFLEERQNNKVTNVTIENGKSIRPVEFRKINKG